MRAAGPEARLAVRRALAGAEVEPAGLPPSSLLVLRSLADPLPGRLSARPETMRPPPEWEAALRASLSERWRHAARPGRGPVPAGANAVYFADPAEMLAAFARDACGGGIEAWWWRALAKGLPGGALQALSALWRREARHVPAAIALLASTGDVYRVFSSLPATHATGILAAVALAFEAPALLAAPPLRPVSTNISIDSGDAMRSPMYSAGLATTETASSADRAMAGTVDEATDRIASRLPWAGFIPADAIPASLGPEQTALAALGLMLHRAPLVARSSAFVARFVRWRADAAAGGSVDSRAPTPLPSSATPRDAHPAHRPITSPAASPVAADDARFPVSATTAHDPLTPPAAAEATDSADPKRAHDGGSGRTTSERVDSTDVDAELDARAESAETGGLHATPTLSERIVDRESGDADASESAAIERPFAPPLDDALVASDACGVFFLVNVLRSMAFFSALDEHFRIPPRVGGWGWMELVARALLAPSSSRFASDPVWRLLAGLDGREPAERPGAGFIAGEMETLPPGWIDLFGGAPPAPTPSPLLGMTANPQLQRFLDLTIPVIRARIESALRRAGDDGSQPFGTALLIRGGTIAASRTHVDVRMALDQATLPVRLAGLDANPGWVPELARVVTFYFA